ncbi:MAG: methyltransferase domain-containing protein [Chloroflexota bacterium]|nr:methyltransferase domain-containing protein [Chloroflexota bacterium]
MAWWETYFDNLYLELDQQLAAPDRERDRQQAEAAVLVAHLAPPARILDLCCGYGRNSIPLALMGFVVTGLDYSGDMLARAGKDAARSGVDVEFRQGDMRELAWVEIFDGCVMLGGSFGIFEEEAENERVFHAVAAALKPGGRFVLDAANRDRIVCDYVPQRWQERGGLLRCVESRFDPVTGVNYARECWLRGGEWTERTHHRRLYTATELGAMLRRAGLIPIAYYGGYDGSEFTTNSHRIIIVAEKGE